MTRKEAIADFMPEESPPVGQGYSRNPQGV